MLRLPADRWIARTGIRTRATMIATGVVAGALLVTGLLLVLLVRRSLIGSLDASARARAHDVVAVAQSGQLPADVASTGEESSVVQVIDSGGAVVAASPNISGEPPMLGAPPLGRGSQIITRTGLPIATDGQAFRVVVEPVRLGSGSGWVYVATSLRQVDLTTARLAGLLALGLPALLVVAAGVSWRAVGRGLRPVEQIRAGAAAIDGESLGTRVPVPPTGDEVARLAQTMNGMLARLEDATLRQRQFVGDASHELRSPLTTLQAEVDIALAHPNGEPQTELLVRLSTQAGKMTHLVDDLLFLAHADEVLGSVSRETVDLDELALSEAGRLRATGATVVLCVLDPARVRGQSTDLARMLRNLGDNAAAYARSTVSLGLRVDGRHALLTVSDDGVGIPLEDRLRVFERFVRLDGARSRPSTGAGAGLGLSICRQIVLRHGGRIDIEPGPGAVFTVRLPLEPTPGATIIAGRSEAPSPEPRGAAQSHRETLASSEEPRHAPRVRHRLDAAGDEHVVGSDR